MTKRKPGQRREHGTAAPKTKPKPKKPGKVKLTIPLSDAERETLGELTRERENRLQLAKSMRPVAPKPQPPKTFEQMDALEVQRLCGSASTEMLKSLYSTSVEALTRLEAAYTSTPDDGMVPDGEGGLHHSPKLTRAEVSCRYMAEKVELLHDELHRRKVAVKLPQSFGRVDYAIHAYRLPNEAPPPVSSSDCFSGDAPDVIRGGRRGARRLQPA